MQTPELRRVAGSVVLGHHAQERPVAILWVLHWEQLKIPVKFAQVNGGGVVI